MVGFRFLRLRWIIETRRVPGPPNGRSGGRGVTDFAGFIIIPFCRTFCRCARFCFEVCVFAGVCRTDSRSVDTSWCAHGHLLARLGRMWRVSLLRAKANESIMSVCDYRGNLCSDILAWDDFLCQFKATDWTGRLFVSIECYFNWHEENLGCMRTNYWDDDSVRSDAFS